MSSTIEQKPLEEETNFDTYEIDIQIFKNGEYIEKTNNKPEQIKHKFKLLQGLTEEELKKKDPNSDFPKYFSLITTKNFKYTGVLSNNLKRENYGYSLMENKDEFLGEYKNEIREGFGIYKFLSNEEEQDIYIGEYKNNKKNGKGLYLKIKKCINDNEPANNLSLINYNCAIGDFEADSFKKGKFFSVINDNETLYKGKINEIGVPSDEDALIVDGNNKIFVGKLINGEMIEGRNIFVDEKGEKTKAYYFSKTNNKDNSYNFDLNKNEEKDNDIIKILKESSMKNYNKMIQNIFKDINEAFTKFENYDTAEKINFENDIKNKIVNEIIIIME